MIDYYDNQRNNYINIDNYNGGSDNENEIENESNNSTIQQMFTFGGPLSGDFANNSGRFSAAWLAAPWEVVSDGRAPLYSLNL